MPLLKDDYKKEEKINGVIYNMSPSAGYQHGIVNSNIHTIVKQGLRGTLCLTFMENLDYRYHQGSDEYWIISPKERAVEIYYLEDGVYQLRYNYILQDDEEEYDYNAKTVITLKSFPNINMTLEEIFENIH